MSGAPTKLTPETQDKIVSMLKAGNYAEVAYTYAGIDRRTYERWIKRGERESSGIFRDFYAAVQQAQSSAEARFVLQINAAANKNWKAAAWLLARRHPERWAGKQRILVEVQRGVEEIMDAVKEHMSKDAYAELIESLAVISGVAEDTARASEAAERTH